MNSLRKIFFPTEEELKEQERRFEEIHNDLLEDRKTVKLVQTDRSFLFCREPFKSFLGDCCFCSHYIDGGGMTEGGWCKLCGEGCGYGFTCKDNDSEWAIEIKEN